MQFCRKRVEAEEWLDRPGLSEEDIYANLRDMETVNHYLGGARAVISHLRPLLERLPAGGELQVLDIACGGGCLLRRIAQLARCLDKTVRGTGVDSNPAVIAYAGEKAQHLPELAWLQADAFTLPFAPQSFDVVICSTFLHHMNPSPAAEFLRSLTHLFRRRLIVSDLAPSFPCYLAFLILARLAGFHAVSRNDGAVSLRRAYRLHELAALAKAAGLNNWSIHRHSVCRMTLVSDARGGEKSDGTRPGDGFC